MPVRSLVTRNLVLGVLVAATLVFPLATVLHASVCCSQCQYVNLCCSGAAACGEEGGGEGCIQGYGCFVSCRGSAQPEQSQWLCSDYGG